MCSGCTPEPDQLRPRLPWVAALGAVVGATHAGLVLIFVIRDRRLRRAAGR